MHRQYRFYTRKAEAIYLPEGTREFIASVTPAQNSKSHWKKLCLWSNTDHVIHPSHMTLPQISMIRGVEWSRARRYKSQMRMHEWSTAHAPTKNGAYLQRKIKIRSIAVEHSDSVGTASRYSRKGGDYNKPHAASICDITAHAILSNLNTTHIVSFYHQLTFAWQSLPRKTGTFCRLVARQNWLPGANRDNTDGSQLTYSLNARTWSVSNPGYESIISMAEPSQEESCYAGSKR